MNTCIVILLGATGDLSKRKIIPALYQLLVYNKVDKLVVLGCAREQATMAAILTSARPFIQNIDETIWQQLLTHSYYQRVDFTQYEDFVALHKTINKLEKEYAITNRLVYCATASQLFCIITSSITQTGILEKKSRDDKPWHRIVYEKPFGHDLQSAQDINTCIQESLNEYQVFRIDHYLTKEIVSNIALLRFTNCVFEPLWNNRFIDHVQIVLSEEIDIENRGIYYDAYGAIRDVVQNHMLQLLTLIGMEAPTKLTGEYIRDQRAQVLKKVVFIDGVYGQYEGYTKEAGVAPSSQTETFATLRLHINNPRWTGVPFYLKTGKALSKKTTSIHIKFKSVDCLLTKQCPADSNWLTIQIEPNAGFSLTLNAKSTQQTSLLMPIEMSYAHNYRFGASSYQAYEVLLEEIMRGEQSVSVRFDEIESAWSLIDTIMQQKTIIYPYKKGSNGPAEELELFSRKHGMGWRS